MTPRRTLALLVLFSVVTLLVSPLIGMEPISLRSVFQAGGDQVDRIVFWQIRAPRVVVAYLAGAALAASGMAFQSIFRNPLATP